LDVELDATMTTQLSLNTPPSAGFDQPFEMLLACHQRVQRMLQLLERLGDHLCDLGVDDAARQAAQDICRYFDLAGPAHHEDEERHLFPVLLAQADAAELVEQLQNDHLTMVQDWAVVRADLQYVAQGHHPTNWPTPRDRWSEFSQLYMQHIQREEAVVYPAAQALFSTAALLAMGNEMAGRRGAVLGGA
jgi:hemerythrin-like domain-containing protein